MLLTRSTCTYVFWSPRWTELKLLNGFSLPFLSWSPFTPVNAEAKKQTTIKSNCPKTQSFCARRTGRTVPLGITREWPLLNHGVTATTSSYTSVKLNKWHLIPEHWEAMTLIELITLKCALTSNSLFIGPVKQHITTCLLHITLIIFIIIILFIVFYFF